MVSPDHDFSKFHCRLPAAKQFGQFQFLIYICIVKAKVKGTVSFPSLFQ
jgi:hypothetical protein